MTMVWQQRKIIGRKVRGSGKNHFHRHQSDSFFERLDDFAAREDGPDLRRCVLIGPAEEEEEDWYPLVDTFVGTTNG